MEYVVYVASVILQLLIMVVSVYHILVGIFAFIGRDNGKEKTHKENKYALVVAAHNEQSVIGQMVDSLKQIDYNKDLFDIFVVADNCTDNTAAVAEAHGARVYKRSSTDKKGKGYALNWMFNKIFELEDENYDVLCVFDADNIIHPDFLKHMNKKFNQGFKAVQGYIDTKNPNDSWITASYAMSFWCVNMVYQTSRSNLGLSNQICGTGFGVCTDVIKEYGWSATCLAEDMEFTMQLNMNNIPVGWAPEAIVYDEKPLKLAQSCRQRTRWMQGHADVCTRFFIPLMKKFIKEKNLLAFDCAIYLVQPFFMIAGLIVFIMSGLQMVFPGLDMWFLTSLSLPPIVWNVLIIFQFFYTPFILWWENKLNKKMIMYYIPYMIYTYTWMPIAVVGVLRKNRKEWSHTKHVRNMTISEIK